MQGQFQRILIIEDDEYAREALEYFLTAEGFRTQSVDNGKAGYRAARRQTPDLIVVDLGLPDMDGQCLIQRLRDHQQLRTTPILVVSGQNRDEAGAPETIGANAYLTKPVVLEQLRQIITSLQTAS